MLPFLLLYINSLVYAHWILLIVSYMISLSQDLQKLPNSSVALMSCNIEALKVCICRGGFFIITKCETVVFCKYFTVVCLWIKKNLVVIDEVSSSCLMVNKVNKRPY